MYFLQEYVTSQTHRTTLGGLQGGEKYLIQVNTVTSKGDSPFSGSLVITTNEITLTQTQKMKNALGINALEETIDKINVKIDSSKAKLTNHDGRIVNRIETIKDSIGKINAKIETNENRTAINEDDIETIRLVAS